MMLPDDFGLTWEQTLAHVCTTARAPDHGSFWQQWLRSVPPHEARLRPADADDDPSDPTMTHTYLGMSQTPLGCRLEMPPGARGGVVLLHGYESVPVLAESIQSRRGLLERGVAVLAVRIRGYAGSRRGVGDLTSLPYGWISHGLETPGAWVLGAAVADVLFAVAALRRSLPRGASIGLMGESFGAGLAVLAAGQAGAIELSNPEIRIDRLVIGLPTFGDWAWRLLRTPLHGMGVGGQVRRYLAARPEESQAIERMLSRFDAAIHARLVQCPALCKLAVRDETVPAPTQAAVYNALGSAPGEKARFLTPFGHVEGGLTDARRHVLFERMADAFLDPDEDPAEVIQRWQGVLLSGRHGPREDR
jgi:cephalosporin-C deacetylase-like acetyl esterase